MPREGSPERSGPGSRGRNAHGVAGEHAALPRPALRPAPARSDQISREIDRDERVVLQLLRRRLLAELGPALAGPRELPTVLDALARAVAEADLQARRLNDARIARRAERPQAPTIRPPPAALTTHACHGAYLGAFADLAAVGRMAVETCLSEHVPRASSRRALHDLAVDLHLRGALWTIEHGGRVHVFRCGADPGARAQGGAHTKR